MPLFLAASSPRSTEPVSTCPVTGVILSFCYHTGRLQTAWWGNMAKVLVRQLDDKLVERLKKRAREHGRSLQSEVKAILEEAVPDYEVVWKRIAKLKKALNRSGRTFNDSTHLIREERDR